MMNATQRQGRLVMQMTALFLSRTEKPVLFEFPGIGELACPGIVIALRRRYDLMRFACAVLILAAAFATLATAIHPYMIPFSISDDGAVAPSSRLALLFWGARVFVLPVTLACTLVASFSLERKVGTEEGRYRCMI